MSLFGKNVPWGGQSNKEQTETGLSAKLVGILGLFLLASLSACASSDDPLYNRQSALEANDPWEPLNRDLFAWNNGLDKVTLKPAAELYRKLPDPIENRFHNFVQNLREPVTIANDILQWEWKRAGTAAGRFGLNTTVGLVGLFDPASHLGLDHHREDFGQTLAVWGVPDGNYFYMPLFGPAPTRDGMAYFVDLLFDPLIWAGGAELEALFWTNTLLGGLDARANAIDILEETEASSVDYYAAVRSLYRQTRAREIRNGKNDFSNLPDFEEFEDEE